MPAWIEQFFAPLASIVPSEPVEVLGAWSTSRRRMYETAKQLGTGAGPFVEVTDAKWSGSLECSVPLAVIAILNTPAECYWVKSNPAVMNPPISVSLHARADHQDGRASFAASVHGCGLPAVPVSCGADLTVTCTLGSKNAIAGRPHLIAERDGVAFVVVILQGSVVKVGRNRLWHLRSELASSLPSDVRHVLERARTGKLSPPRAQ